MTDTDTVLDVGLDDWLAASVSEPDWEPDDQADANRLLGAIRGIDRQLAEDKATARRVAEEATDWYNARAAVLERRKGEIERLLEGWARMRHRVSSERETTWDLPNGVLRLRKAQPRVEVTAEDEGELARQLEDVGYAGMVIVKRSVSKDAVKKAAAAGAEIEHETPAGYGAHAVVDQATGVVLDGLVLLVPTEKSFTAKARPPVVGS